MVVDKVLVVGGDHHNTLAVIRSLGRARIDFKVLIHGNYSSISDIHISASRYVKSGMLATCPEEDTILEETIYEYGNLTDVRWVLIPCSDFAAYVIDKSTILSPQQFILPGFTNNRGKVALLMDKYEQKLWADRQHIPMAKTWSVNCTDRGFVAPEDVVYPCIIKPEISALGKKTDIVICRDSHALGKGLEELAKKGYRKVLLQQFLIKEHEECAYGCLINQEPYICGGIFQKIRECLGAGGGSTSYGYVEDDKYFRDSLAYQVLEKLWKQGYRGMYDIELLVCKEQVYLNEINFRTSGSAYSIAAANINLSLIWFMDMTEQALPVNLNTRIYSKLFFMDELSDIRHIKEGGISFLSWISSVLQTAAFAKWSLDDIGGSLSWYKPYIKRALKKYFHLH